MIRGDRPEPATALLLHRLSLLVLAAALVSFAVPWTIRSWGALFDPGVQTDDARTHLVGFHKFTPGAPLANDPVTANCLAMQPLLPRLLGSALAPLTGVYGLAKVFQFLSLAIVGLAAWVLARSRRAGPGASAMVILSAVGFPWWIGGTPRHFGVPLLALWIAGAVSGRFPIRALAAVLSAGIYPVATLIILAAEGLLALAGCFAPPHARRVRHLAASAGMLGACALVIGAGRAGNRDLGPVITRAAIAAEPAYYAGIPQIATPPPLTPFTEGVLEYLAIFDPRPRTGDDATNRWAGTPAAILAWALVAALAWALAARRIPLPAPAAALFGGSVICYWTAAALAFRLYLPQRYPEYGFGAAAAAFVISSLGGLRAPRRSFLAQQTVRNFLGAAFVAGFWMLWGGNYEPSEGANIRREDHAALYDFLNTLPPDSRLASHPNDGDDIPFWGRRAALCGFELDQPYYSLLWREAFARAWDGLRAMYATDRKDMLRIADRHKITHLLAVPARYGEDFRKRGRYERLPPADVKAFLKTLRREDLVLREPPPEAIVFRDNRFSVIEVARLRAAWNSPADSPTPPVRQLP